VSQLYDVALVGFGPVGQLLAILLGQRGRRVIAFERWPGAYPLPRAVHYDHEVARILQSAGVADALAPLTESAPVYEWRNAAGEVLLRFGREKGNGFSGWPDSNMFSQPELERILEARAASLPGVEIRRGCEVARVAEIGDEVELELADGARVRARYAVGCDGANSGVRTQLGTNVSDLGFAFDWLVVDVIPHAPRVWDPLNWQLCDPLRPTTLVSGGPGRRRFEFMRLPHETLESLNSVESAWRLLEPWGFSPANAALERHAVYTFRARWADTWRQGRVLLAGDAAHQMPPFAGQGMCSGLRDAANLAWKLDLVLAGLASDALLDSYTSERLAHVRMLIDFSVALGRVICVADPAEAAARDAQMAAAARAGGMSAPPPSSPIGPGCLLAGSPGAAQLFPQDQVRVGAVSGLYDDVVGSGFALVSTHGDPATRLEPALAAWFSALGGVSAHVAADGPVVDVTGRYAKFFASLGAQVVLQRPDFAIFGSAARIDDANSLVRALREQLGAAGG
jgi:2-polyprenyl-6-methoxyphenol hydroxylase-like FAD-dependent oxidoreductase